MRHPHTQEPVCKAHYQQALLHPERPLRPLRRTRPADFRCVRCGVKPHYARDLCYNCYMYDLNRARRAQRRPRQDPDTQG